MGVKISIFLQEGMLGVGQKEVKFRIKTRCFSLFFPLAEALSMAYNRTPLRILKETPEYIWSVTDVCSN